MATFLVLDGHFPLLECHRPFWQGETGDSFYLIMEGTAKAWIRDESVQGGQREVIDGVQAT